MSGAQYPLMSKATAPVTGGVTVIPDRYKQFSLVVRGTGAVSATATVYATPENVTDIGYPVATLNASGTTAAIDVSSTVDGPMDNYYVVLTAISGTGAQVSVYADTF